MTRPYKMDFPSMNSKTLLIIKNVSIFDGTQIKNNRTVLIVNHKIYDIKSNNPINHKYNSKFNSKFNSIKTIDGKGNLLIPGFIDIQVNGGGGQLFNDASSTADIKKIFAAHLKYGTTSILPTFISDSLNKLKMCSRIVEELIENPHSGVLGLHVEGPFLNPEKSGIHPKNHLIAQSNEWISLLTGSKIQNLLITLAPEMVSQSFIRTLVKCGIHVFAGHTNASESVIKKSFESGLSGVTHLFNACSQITSRNVGVVGSGLLNKNILCSLIADGYHTSNDALKLAFSVKDYRKFALISDAMPSVGTTLKEFSLFKEKIYRHKNKLSNSDGVLAGAHLTMLLAFQNLMKHKLVKLEEAIPMTSTNQAAFFHFKGKGAVLPNHDADLLILDKNNFNLLTVIFAGSVKNIKNLAI